MNNNNYKILMVSTDIAGQGGIASVVKAYADGGLCDKLKVEFLTTHSDNALNSKMLFFLFAILRLFRYLFDKKCRVFHIHSASRMSFARKSIIFWLVKLFRKKTIFHLHGGEFMYFYQTESGWLKKRYIRSVLSQSDYVLVLSERWVKNIESICSTAKIVQISNPVSISKTPNFRRNSKQQLLFLGKICKEKGFWDLLDALELIKQQFPDVNLHFGGNGDIDAAKATISEKQLEENATYLGWVSGNRKQEELNSARLYILPSYNEGLPMGVLEAMAHGLPVVASNVGGIPDVIEDHRTGFIVEPGDKHGLAEKICLLLEDSMLAETIAKAAYSTVNSFSVDLVISQLVEIYNTLLPRDNRNSAYGNKS